MSLQLLNLLVALLYQVKIPTWFLSDFFFPLSQSSSFNQTQRPGDIVSSKSTNPREGDSDCAVFRSIFFLQFAAFFLTAHRVESCISVISIVAPSLVHLKTGFSSSSFAYTFTCYIYGLDSVNQDIQSYFRFCVIASKLGRARDTCERKTHQ